MKILKKLGLLAAVAGLLGAGAAVLGNSPVVGVKAEGTEVNPDNFYIYVNRNGHYENGYEWYLRVNGIQDAIKPAGYLDIRSSLYLASYAVPLNVVSSGTVSMELIVYSWKTDSGEDLITPVPTDTKIPFTYNSGDNAQVYYIGNEIAEGVTTWQVTKGIAAQDWDPKEDAKKIKASAVATVLSRYGACSTNKDVGVGNWPTIVSTWIHDNDNNWYLDGNLGGNTITEWNGTEVDAWVKYQQMEATYKTISNPEGANDSAVPATIAGFFVVIGIAAVGGLTAAILYRRRRTAE